MSKQKTIKEIFSDALYWAMSPKSKGNTYHLTRVEESVLRKLIRYDKTNPKIDYTSEWIAKHTYLDVSQIEKVIPALEKKGFIRTIHFTLINDKSQKIKRRIINIKWDFITFVLSSVPKQDSTQEGREALPLITPSEKELEESLKEIESNEVLPTDSTEIKSLNNKNDAMMLDYDKDINQDKMIHELIIKKMIGGETFKFIPVQIKLNTGETVLDEGCKIPGSKKYATKSKLLAIDPTVFS